MNKSIRLAALVAALAANLAAGSPATPRPNILFIAVDDLRPELGCYGRDHIQSPNIDRIAKAGIVFDRAYCQEAVCSPSRTSLMTGTRPDTSKVWDLETHFRTTLPDVVTLSQNFKNNGWFVQGMGKIYHGRLDDPPSWSVPWQAPKSRPYALKENLAIISGPAAKKKGAKLRGPAFESADVADDVYLDGKIANLAVKTLRNLAGKEEPFFLAVGFAKPHLPFVAPKKYWDLYDPEKIELAPNPFFPKGAPPYAILTAGELSGYHGIPRGPVSDDLARQLRHGYYAAVSYADAQIGKVLDELDRLGLRDNTIIILWGDHGWKLGEHNAWAKHSNVENDVNAPLILSVPGMKHAGAHSSALVEFVDIYPTLAELAGIPLPAHLEGTSFKPLLDEPGRPWKSAAFSQYPRASKGASKSDLMGYSMRTDRYRFTIWLNDADHSKVDSVELYDHHTDPEENINIADEPEHAGLIKRLTAQWKRGWQGAKPPSSADHAAES